VTRRQLRRAFHYQRKGAHKRGIRFLLTFEEWMKIWLDSGHLSERGKYRGQYVMSRPGDRGPYAVGNVKIVTVEANIIEGKLGKHPSKQARANMSAAVRPPITKAARRRMSASATRNWQEIGASCYGR